MIEIRILSIDGYEGKLPIEMTHEGPPGPENTPTGTPKPELRLSTVCCVSNIIFF